MAEAGLSLITTSDVVVIGGGVLGAATAYHLAKEGVDTILIDKGDFNREASGTNAGSLHFQIMRQHSYSQGRLSVVRESVQLHMEAARLWRGLEGELQTDLGVRLDGGLMVAETAQQFADLRKKHTLERDTGLSTELLSIKEALAIAPELSPTLRGADYHPGEGQANPLLVTPAYLQASATLGARVMSRTELVAINRSNNGYELRTTRGRVAAKRVVNAAGAGAAAVARMLDLTLPIGIYPLQVNVTESRPHRLGQLVQHVGRRLTLKQTPSGTFIIGGGWPGRRDADGRAAARCDSIAGNAWVALRVMPYLHDVRITRTWGGIIAVTPDRMPLIGEHPRAKRFYSLHVGAGFTLAPIAGRLMSDLVLRRPARLPLESYGVTRLA